MKTLPRRSSTAAIDMSPLIDMVFILLIFFVVSSTFVKDAAVALKRPSARSAAEASAKALRVAIDPQGGLWLDGAPVKPWMLQSRLRDAFRDGAEKEVLVVADRAVAVERLVEVVDQCRLAGAADVTVATEKELGG
jgi:biopolymer transport protein ExbD